MSTIDSSSTKQPFGWVHGKEETTHLGVIGVSYQIRMSPTKDDPLYLVTVFFKTVENRDDTVDHLTLLKGMRKFRKDTRKDELLAVNNTAELTSSSASEINILMTTHPDKGNSKKLACKTRIRAHAQARIQAKAGEFREEEMVAPLLRTLDQINQSKKPASKHKSKKHKSAPEQPMATISLGAPRKKARPDAELLQILEAMNKEYEAANKVLEKHTSKSFIPGLAFVKNALASTMPGNNEYKTALLRAGTAAQSLRNELGIQGNKNLPLSGEEECIVENKIQWLRLDIEKDKQLPK